MCASVDVSTSVFAPHAPLNNAIDGIIDNIWSSYICYINFLPIDGHAQIQYESVRTFIYLSIYIFTYRACDTQTRTHSECVNRYTHTHAAATHGRFDKMKFPFENNVDIYSVHLFHILSVWYSARTAMRFNRNSYNCNRANVGVRSGK